MDYKIDQNGIRPLQDKLEAITKIEIPKNEKEIKSFLGAIQYLSTYMENLSAQTDILRKLLKNRTSGNGQENIQTLQQPQKTNNPVTILSTLQPEKRKHTNIRRQHKRTGSHTMAETKRWKFKTDRIC